MKLVGRFKVIADTIPSGMTDILTLRKGGDPNGKPVTLEPENKLQFELKFYDGPLTPNQPPPPNLLGTVTLIVNIVAAPVTPAIESGFALLRGGANGAAPVKCVRFAWGRPPERIEPVNPADLKHEIVRRRAVFQWSDTYRTGDSPTYVIQKIAPFGSTHFPGLHGPPD